MLKNLGILAGLGAMMAGYALYEPLNIQLSNLEIQLSTAKGHLPQQGLRILHISDTHFQGVEWREQRKIEGIRRLTENLSYDLLIHTGDFIHLDCGTDNVCKLLDLLPKPRLGSYGVLGNHDYAHYATFDAFPRMWHTFQQEENSPDNSQRSSTLTRPVRFGHYVRNTPLDIKRTGYNDVPRLISILEEKGLQILYNEAIHLCHQPDEPDGVDLHIAGIDDWIEGTPQMDDALGSVPEDSLTLLLSHNPDALQHDKIQKVDLMLSGHTHGGQLVFPFWGAAHTQTEYVGRHNVSGYHQQATTHYYISRGIGEGIPLRFQARPQVTLITVKMKG